MKLDLETPVLSTGGVITAIYNFVSGEPFQIFVGLIVSLSVIFLNVSKAYRVLTDKKNKDDNKKL